MTDQADFLERIAESLAGISGRIDALERKDLAAKLEPDGGLSPGGRLPGSAGSGAVYDQATLAPGSVTSSAIADGAIDDVALFASTIIPPRVVTSLPSLPSSTWPQGSLVFLTTDQKLYRNTTGSAWSKATDGADIVANSITAGQIATGAIGADEIAANSITADALAIGSAGSVVPLTNGDFETGTFTGWAAIGSATYVEASPTGWQGAYRCVIYKSSGDSYAYIDQRPIPVRNGETVVVSARLGYAGSAATARIQLVHLDSAGAELSYPQVDVSISSDQTVNWACTINHTDARYVALRIFNITDGTYLIVDDVSLSRAINLSNSDGTVFINSGGVQITNGKLTVYNDNGSTVVIDGTSNMFKIQASGTTSLSIGAGANASTNTQLTSLGNGFTVTPAHLSFLSTGSTSAAYQQIGELEVASLTGYVAGSSGGSPTVAVLKLTVFARVQTVLASGYINVYLTGSNAGAGSQTVYSRYHVLKEAAM